MGEENVYSSSTSVSVFIIEGSQDRNSSRGRNLEKGADAEAMEWCYILACSACFLIEPRTSTEAL